MPKALEMLHERDPRDELMEQVTPYLRGVRVTGSRLLLAVYMGAEKTKSGLYIASKTTDEFGYMGKVGLVVGKGPRAYAEDETHKFSPEEAAEIGDWVLFTPGDTVGFVLGSHKMRLLEDVHVRAILPDPSVVAVHN